MEPRFNLLDSPTAAKVVKRFYSTSLALQGSTLPKSVRELVDLRVAQINGCGFCVDLHAKEAAAAGETAVRLGLVAASTRMNVIVRNPGGSYEAGGFAGMIADGSDRPPGA
ncbi:carboxymuconolactone decarboxylase family protein [Streptomyces sp. NPDC014870]|uniref:carboxymuconolactone decarboxylase family protein n=1 Tax=Streptomyces sp. NPDC014870 TaxID=3364925 RepID=UPI0036FB7AA0